MAEKVLAPSREASVVLDIGGDIGAFVLNVAAEWLDHEIDLEPVDPSLPKTHSAVRARHLGSGTRYAAVYPSLRAGRYRIAGSEQVVEIVGGEIADLVYEPTHEGLHHHH